jgi:hypothetical protein
VLGWWSEEFDRVPGCGVTECGGIDGVGVGEAWLAGGFAGRGGELFEAGGSGDLQGVQRLVFSDGESVRAVDR